MFLIGMAKLPCIPPEKLARILEKCGFELERISGSHHFYHNPEFFDKKG